MAAPALVCKHRRVSSEGDIAAFTADLPLSGRAAAWVVGAHAGQERQADGAPFVLHPFEVAMLLHAGGYRDDVVAVALLHDAIEKGGATRDGLRDVFGPDVAGMVDALTEDETIGDYEERKTDLRRRAEAADDDVVAVFAADKVVKARELRLVAAADRMPAREVACKRAHYVASLEILERRLPGHPFTESLRFELAAHLLVPALAWLRPAGAPVAVAR
jgi:(p)ppGpp synthase/HD superfamily hydrolase